MLLVMMVARGCPIVTSLDGSCCNVGKDFKFNKHQHSLVYATLQISVVTVIMLLKDTVMPILLEEDGCSFRKGKMEVRTLGGNGKTIKMDLVA